MEKNMQHKPFKTSLSISLLLLSSFVQTQAQELDPITITADFRTSSLADSTMSVSVLTEDALKKRGAQHVEETLNATPNVNMSSGASRAKYFQIRGIGERSQFVTPVNPSVGLFINGFDFSRSGGSATTFDINQVEVIRGPQGTRYGASALAGIINLQSNEPTDTREGHIETTLGNYGKKSLGIAVGGPLIKNTLLGRFSLHSNTSDGTISNTYLKKKDTNKKDELTVRGHLKWIPNNDITVDLKYLHFDINNGYDAFTFDNSRHTLSDQPGKDSQKTNAFSVGADWNISPSVKLQSKVNHSDSELEYSYDEDWSHVGQFDDSLYPYHSFDQYNRTRSNSTAEIKLLSNDEGKIFNNKTDWVVGIYHAKKSEDLERKYTYLENNFLSQYNTKTTAIFGQLDTKVNNKLKLITGLRLEQWKADYSDSNTHKVNTNEVLYGGKLGLEYDLTPDQLSHISLSRGYKAGGVNTDGSLPKKLLDYGTEYLWNFELGLNSFFLDDALTTRLSAFYAKRKNQQVKSSIVTTRNDGSSEFTEYFGNAAAGHNLGLEAELSWKVNPKLTLRTSLGLLEAKFDHYNDPESKKNGVDLAGRDQAHAPNYQYTLGAEYALSENITAGINIEGKDSFYFSDRHNAKAHSYNLLNASLSHKKKNWNTTLWARNLLNKDYAVRGFGSFGNNPGNGYTTETYTQKGEPRTFGLTVSYDF